jgi:hypothetical protein
MMVVSTIKFFVNAFVAILIFSSVQYEMEALSNQVCTLYLTLIFVDDYLMTDAICDSALYLI